ncbi:DUF6303 family protein [Streptomyces sp. NBC_00264]|uniref:DUF6303 family protein n=1 Tax=unclassified Streptomyces TaxID=2593676 RepID=UPI002259C6AB|nr:MULTISPECIES: DUF6303 family protein [unclassified Streptomyces]MCX5159978.1 DUF6303 family protein [Streptomyces sp. NBC_00305]MCX5218501.1 DUF6303 family protein [Streptomyces sp. NBC_00264]
MQLPQARMATGVYGTWELYILTDAPSLEWPEYEFHRVVPVPTPEERAAALADLGYAVVDGAEWEWRETHPTPAAYHLVASIPVRPTGSAGGGGGR